MFQRDGDLFIEYTFKRVAREKFKILQSECDRVFNEALNSGFIGFVRNVGSPPGMPAYRIGKVKGEVMAEVDPKKIEKNLENLPEAKLPVYL